MSWFTHFKGFEIGASCQEMRGVYGIRIIRSKSEVYDHPYLRVDGGRDRRRRGGDDRGRRWERCSP